MVLSYAHAAEFVRQVRPILERHDAAALLDHLAHAWPNDKLHALLTTGNEDAVKISLVCLSLTGGMEDAPAIAPLLHDDDAATAAFAELALLSIWFRAGDDESNVRLARAVHRLSDGDVKGALELLEGVVTSCPTFAEPHHQRATALFLEGDYLHALQSARRALELNPHHFGAMASLGHCYASLGYWHRALEAYRQALQLHPRLEGIRQAIQQVRNRMRQVDAPDPSLPSTP